jgi:hypothetical protein
LRCLPRLSRLPRRSFSEAGSAVEGPALPALSSVERSGIEGSNVERRLFTLSIVACPACPACPELAEGSSIEGKEPLARARLQIEV